MTHRLALALGAAVAAACGAGDTGEPRPAAARVREVARPENAPAERPGDPGDPGDADDAAAAPPEPAPPSLPRSRDGDPPRLRNDVPASLRPFADDLARQASAYPAHYVVDAALADGDTRIALTFDDGPDPKQTTVVLDVLAREGVRATFFVVGARARKHPDLVRRIVADGHAIGGHGWEHVWLSKLAPEAALRDHVERTADLLGELTGARPTFFRPPYGSVTDEQLAALAAAGYATINWSVDSFDWRTGFTADQVRDEVLAWVHPGAIVLLHDAGGRRAATLAALPSLITELRARGYTFATVPELRDAAGTPLPR